MKMGSI